MGGRGWVMEGAEREEEQDLLWGAGYEDKVTYKDVDKMCRRTGSRLQVTIMQRKSESGAKVIGNEEGQQKKIDATMQFCGRWEGLWNCIVMMLCILV